MMSSSWYKVFYKLLRCFYTSAIFFLFYFKEHYSIEEDELDLVESAKNVVWRRYIFVMIYDDFYNYSYADEFRILMH